MTPAHRPLYLTVKTWKKLTKVTEVLTLAPRLLQFDFHCLVYGEFHITFFDNLSGTAFSVFFFVQFARLIAHLLRLPIIITVVVLQMGKIKQIMKTKVDYVIFNWTRVNTTENVVNLSVCLTLWKDNSCFVV